MTLLREHDLGTPARSSDTVVTIEVDGMPVTVPAGTSVMRAAALAGIDVPKLCATDSLEAFGSCRLCLVEIEGVQGHARLVHDARRRGDARLTQTSRLEKLRRGVMELYISDHPLDCLTCAANGDCELQDMAGAVGLRDVRYGYAGDNHLDEPKDETNPYFTFDPAKCIVCSRCVRACEETQGTFALTIAGRGFDSKVVAERHELLRLRVRLLRRLRAGVPDGDARGEVGHRPRRPAPLRAHDLRVLRRRLLVQGRAARRRGRPDGAVQGRRRQRRPLVREGPLRLGLRDPQGPGPLADDPRVDRPGVAGGLLGGGDHLRGDHG